MVDPSSLAEEGPCAMPAAWWGRELVIEEVRAMEGGRPHRRARHVAPGLGLPEAARLGRRGLRGVSTRRRAWAGLCNVGSPDVRSYFSRVSEIPLEGMLRQEPGVAGYSAAKCRPPTLPP